MDNDDRSEKIITLARNMLQQSETQTSQTYSLKTMALVALLSASASGTVCVVLAEHYRPLNRYEKTELRALIHYAAKTRQQTTATLEADLRQQFTIESIDDLTLAQMGAARIFLQSHIRSPSTE
jgi:hypothetical protein